MASVQKRELSGLMGETARYVRLYADADGESHFSDEETELKSVNFAPPASPVNVSAFTPAKHFVLLHAPAGWFGDWHPPHIDSSFSSSSGRWKSE